MKTSATVGPLVFALVICSWSVASAQVLRWKLDAGDQFDVAITQNSTINTEVNTRKVEMRTELLVELLWDVQTVKDDRASIEVSYRRVQ
ncbi:MAG: hypothetical protein GTO41_20790, partial [Burkholderiales bacterium]|nr:hypothetical protein [Burkholderiales bacterium]